MTALACVLFDLDGVLVHYDHETRVRLLAACSGTAEADVMAALFDSGLEQDADLGSYDAEQQANELSLRLGATVTLADCLDSRAASMTADDAMVTLATQVSQRATVAILSNNGWLVRDHLGTLCPPLMPLFAGRVFCSAEFGVAKPDPAVFSRCVAKLGLIPKAVLFIDDKVVNVDGARIAGLRVHHYRDIATPSALLHELDLPEPDHVET